MSDSEVKKRVVGVDISLEQTTYALVDVRGNILAKDSFPTLDYPDVNAFVAVLSERIVEFVERNGGYETVRSVGISCPSANFLTGSVAHAANLPWKGVVPLAAMLRDRLGLAVAVGNDAMAIAMGEQAFGSAHGMSDFIVVSLGTGMGSCVFSDGNVCLGYDGFAGEIGHTCVNVNGRQCGCGKIGCLETYTATRGIVTTALELLEESDKPSLMRQEPNLSPKKIKQFCEQGDELAIETYRRTGEVLGLGLANYASLLDPEAIIFTGGISKAGKWLFEPAKKSFDEHVFHNLRGKVKFLTSDIDDRERDVLGASVLAWKVKEYSLFK